ncbi:MAG: PAS domain S-box protein [Desulfarculaceae bacterium]|nr:PAS domain S-box protein [Desulfarculaceae bacterium]
MSEYTKPAVGFFSRAAAHAVILALREREEMFLAMWPVHMKAAGYLEHTTAKREDCAQAFWGVLDPLFVFLEESQSPDFSQLILNERAYALFAVTEARRHRFRGITAEMYLGCFKTLVHCLEGLIHEMDYPWRDKADALRLLRNYLDAVETVFIGDWTTMSQREADNHLDETNRRLTLEKNKYQNILESTRDLVLLTDGEGLIQEINAAARAYYEQDEVLGEPFWQLLGLEGRKLAEVTRYYPAGHAHEISLFGEAAYFVLKIIPLSEVSLASDGYMVLLNNVSCVVDQREQLEKRVQQRTRDLEESGKLFRSLFKAAGEGILLVDTNFRIVEVNHRACDIFGMPPEQFFRQDVLLLTAPNARETLNRVIRGLDEEEIWVGEMAGVGNTGEEFPMEVTVNRVDLAERTLFHVVVRDITPRKALEESLRRDKVQLEEMNVTLRNVMKNIGKEKQELEQAITQNIENFLLTALDKIKDEPSRDIRASYLNLIRDQLVGLTKGFSRELDPRLLTLTRTEMLVCQLIQAGSSSKEIAESLNLALDTVHSHRKNIRRKLDLRGHEVSLFSYLSAKPLDRD